MPLLTRRSGDHERIAENPGFLLVSNDLTLETSCTDFLVYASAGMITV
jgi:hypothetical protein